MLFPYKGERNLLSFILVFPPPLLLGRQALWVLLTIEDPKVKNYYLPVRILPVAASGSLFGRVGLFFVIFIFAASLTEGSTNYRRSLKLTCRFGWSIDRVLSP